MTKGIELSLNHRDVPCKVEDNRILFITNKSGNLLRRPK